MIKMKMLQKSKKGPLVNRFDVVKSKKNKIINKKSAKLRAKIFKKLGKVALIFLAIFMIIGLIGGIKVLSWLQELDKSLPSPDNIFPEGEYATEIYDRIALSNGKDNGTRLYRMIGGVNSDPVSLDEISEPLKWAFLAAEDRNFYNHPGFDAQGMLRSVKNIITGSSDPGGASTITQQLVRIIPNTTVGADRTFERKIKEILMSIKLEQSYSKDQILEMYLRVAPMGSNISGVKTGAKFYFGKDLKDLTLAQCVVLAAIVQNPVYLSPTLSIDPEIGEPLLKSRFEYILDQMKIYLSFINDEIRKNKGDEFLEDQITIEMIDAALAEDWKATLKPAIVDQKAAHFVNYVIKELQEKNYYKNERPFTTEELQTGGYSIYTTLDYNLQLAAERAVLKGGNDFKYLNAYNSAVMTTIPSTGEIITMAGSRDFYSQKEACDENNQNCKFDPQVNILDSYKEPGSTNKPFGYYEAFRQGKLFTNSFLPDVPIKVGDSSGAVYDPKNWNSGFDGVGQTAELMLRRSRNLPALFVMQMIGVERYIEIMKSFGYNSYEGQQLGLSAILGGVSIKPIEHAQGYGVFANGGDLVKLEAIKKIVDKNGEVIFEAKPIRTPTADPQAVYLINEVLNNYDSFSTNFWDGRRMSGKTGTSETNIDSWFVAYTPEMVTVSWSGNNNRDPLNAQLGWANILIFPWLGEYLKEIGGASYFSQKSEFSRPAYVYRGGGQCNSNGQCFGLGQGWMIQDRTPAFDHIRNTFKVCVDQKDKRARPIDIAMGFAEDKVSDYWVSPVPEWQNFVDEFIQKIFGGPNGGPKADDFCTIDRSGGVPGPFFANFVATSAAADSVNIRGGVFTSSGSVVSTSFYLDNTLIPECAVAAQNFSSFDITCNISSLGLDGGTYKLRGEATDSNGLNGNSTELTVNLNNGISSIFNFTSMPPTPLTWGVTVGSGINHNIQVSYNLGTATNVELWQVKNSSEITKLGTMTPASYFFQYSWGGDIPNENATYTFFVTANVGGTGTTKSVTSSGVEVIGN